MIPRFDSAVILVYIRNYEAVVELHFTDTRTKTRYYEQLKL